MTSREQLSGEPAFVLHGQAYRETSEIVEVLTYGHGRLGVVARGARRPRSRLKCILQPFQPLTISAAGRGSLLNLTTAETAGQAIQLDGDRLMAAFYINELVMRFLHRGDPHAGLYDAYVNAVTGLGARRGTQAELRCFEMSLLSEVGYGLNLGCEADSGSAIDPGRRYRYILERGPVEVPAEEGSALTFDGRELIAIAHGDFRQEANLQPARRLLRAVLDHYLAGTPLRTRQVYAAMRR